jgi:hypothetical protein
MSNADYPTCINELYQSEVFGEGAFLALMAVAKNEHEKHHFGAFLQMETETKARLRPLLLKYGLKLDEEQDISEKVAGLVAAYQANSWVDFLSGTKPVFEQFLARFKEIAAAGPAEDQVILRSMITHEEAFISWVDRETAGEEGSLDAVNSQILNKIPES